MGGKQNKTIFVVLQPTLGVGFVFTGIGFPSTNFLEEILLSWLASHKPL